MSDPRAAAKAAGALCDVCLLRQADGPVYTEWRGSTISVYAEAPGKHEVEERPVPRPLVGPSGLELKGDMEAVGALRSQVNIGNVLACRPPNNDLDALDRRWRALNEKLVEKGVPTVPHPIDCCKPRLYAELAKVDHVIALGATANAAITGRKGIMEHQGHLIEVARAVSAVHEVQGVPSRVSLEPQAGAPPWKVVPVLHPAAVLRKPRWRPVLRRALGRAFRWFRGATNWEPPKVVANPLPSELRRFCERLATMPYATYDTETDGIEPLLAQLRCIQIGKAAEVHVVHFRSVEDDAKRFYTDADAEQGWRVLREALLHGGIGWAGHNAGKYDRMVMEEAFWREEYNRQRHDRTSKIGGYEGWQHPVWMGDHWDLGPDWSAWFARLDDWRALETPTLVLDTLPTHRAVDPELPHDLGFIGGFYLDVHDWKADHSATTAKTDHELGEVYGATDTAVNDALVPILAGKVKERNQQTVLDWDHKMTEVCCGMHRIGILVDQERVHAHAARLLAAEKAYEVAIMERLAQAGVIEKAGYHERGPQKGSPLFNPRSGKQLQELLFGTWALQPPEDMHARDLYTAAGERSTKDSVLRAHLADPTLTAVQREVLKLIRRSKRVRKLYSTFVAPLLVAKGDLWGPPHPQSDNRRWPPPKYLKRDQETGEFVWEDPRLCVWPDGRLRVSWNAHVTTVGRLSCGGKPSKYNLQTVPKRYLLVWPDGRVEEHNLRDMFIPAPGHKFVAADLDQVHLRIIANRWGIPSLLDDFREGRDPHGTFAEIAFQSKYRKADGYNGYGVKPNKKTLAEVLRDLGKTLRYTGAYGAGPRTIWITMTRAENEAGELMNTALKLREVRILHDNWMKAEPQWREGWQREMDAFRSQGYLESPLLGRRCDFADGWSSDGHVLDEDDDEYLRGNDLTTKVNNYCTLAGEADIMIPITCQVGLEDVPWGSLGRSTGMVGQFHDQILLEVPADRTEWAEDLLERRMNITVPGWPVPITAGAHSGDRWSEV